MTLTKITICGAGNGAHTLLPIAAQNLSCDVDLYAPRGERVPGRIVCVASADAPLKGVSYLLEAVAKVATSEDWQSLLRISGSFHRYSPNNQLLLAAQGAQGVVASFHTWKQIPAVDGHVCRIRKGETALRVYAPLRSKRRELDPDTGEIQEPSIVGFKLVPVFHQGQLVAPPDLPAQPKLLDGQDPPPVRIEQRGELVAKVDVVLHDQDRLAIVVGPERLLSDADRDRILLTGRHPGGGLGGERPRVP